MAGGWCVSGSGVEHRRGQQVGRDLDVDRSARVDQGQPPGPDDDVVQVGGVLDAHLRLGHRPEERRLVRRLVQHTGEHTGHPRRRRDVGGDDEQRRVRGPGLSGRGDDVGGARSGGRQRDAEPAGRARVAVRGVAGCLLVPHADQAHAAVRERLPGREVVHAGQPERDRRRRARAGRRPAPHLPWAPSTSSTCVFVQPQCGRAPRRVCCPSSGGASCTRGRTPSKRYGRADDRHRPGRVRQRLELAGGHHLRIAREHAEVLHRAARHARRGQQRRPLRRRFGRPGPASSAPPWQLGRCTRPALEAQAGRVRARGRGTAPGTARRCRPR